MNIQKKIFVSWTQVNKQVIEKYMSAVEEKSGLSYYLSDNDCVGDFEKWFKDSINSSPFFIAYITKESINKEWCKKEIELAIAKYKKYNYKFITFLSDVSLEEINKLDHNHHIYKLINDCKVSGVFTNNMAFDNIIKELTFKFTIMRKNYELFLYKESLNQKLNHCIILGGYADISLDKFYVDREIVDEENVIVNIETILENNRVLIRGEAGSGKTIFIKKLAQNINSQSNYIYILDSNDIKEIINQNLSIIAYLYRKSNCSLITFDEFSSLMSNTSNYLTVEGLDEVIGNNKEYLLEKVLSFSNEYNNFKIIFTSRNDENINGIKKYKIKPLNQECINNVATNFINIYNKDKEKGFFIALNGIKDELKNNPLLLTQLAYIYSKKESLPNNLYDLYSIISDLIIKQTNEKNIEVILNNKIQNFVKNNKKILSKCAFNLVVNRSDNTYSFKKALDSCVDCDDTNEIYDYLITRSIVVNDQFYHKTLLEYYASLYIFEACYEDDIIDGYIPNNKLKALITKYNIVDLYEMLLLQVDNKCQEEGIEQSIAILLNNNTLDYFYLLNIVSKRSVFGKNLLKPLFNDAYNGINHPYHELLYYTVEYNLYKEILLLAKDVNDKVNYVYSFIQDIFVLYSDINILDYKDLYDINKLIDDNTERYNNLINYYRDCKVDYNFYYKKDEYNINVINDNKLIGHIIVNSQKDLSNKVMRYVLGLSVLDDINFYQDINIYYNKRINTLIVPYELNSLVHFWSFENLKRIIYSDNVTSIGIQAFNNCTSLTSITIPSSVTSIGYRAFEDCESLTNVYYEGTIEDWCNIIFYSPMSYAQHFYILDSNKEYQEVTEIVIPNTITSIGNYQFYGFCNVTSITIPLSVVSIGHYAFQNCSNAIINCEAIAAPSGWSKFWNYESAHHRAIPVCWGMISNVVKINDCDYKLDFNSLTATIFRYTGNSTIVEIPPVIKHNCTEYQVTNIENKTFSGCSHLLSVTIPTGLISIGKSAFEECTSLTSITIPSRATLPSLHPQNNYCTL